MIKKIASLMLGAVLVPQPCNAQSPGTVAGNDDVWTAYERTGDNGLPLVVMARTGNPEVEKMLRDGLATAVDCRADPAIVNDQGMPQGTDRLYAIEDQLAAEPALRTANALHIASVTGNGERRMFYVHASGVDFGPFMQQIHVQGFSCSASSITITQGFIDLVTPTNLERQLNGDQAVIANLQKNGDDGHLPRKTDFWFYGQKEALQSLGSVLGKYGFLLDHWLSDPTGMVLFRKMPVDLATFEATTPVLVSATERSGVEYDGWETPIIRSASDQSRIETTRH